MIWNETSGIEAPIGNRFDDATQFRNLRSFLYTRNTNQRSRSVLPVSLHPLLINVLVEILPIEESNCSSFEDSYFLSRTLVSILSALGFISYIDQTNCRTLLVIENSNKKSINWDMDEHLNLSYKKLLTYLISKPWDTYAPFSRNPYILRFSLFKRWSVCVWQHRKIFFFTSFLI